jgi:hypothetical protein
MCYQPPRTGICVTFSHLRWGDASAAAAESVAGTARRRGWQVGPLCQPRRGTEEAAWADGSEAGRLGWKHLWAGGVAGPLGRKVSWAGALGECGLRAGCGLGCVGRWAERGRDRVGRGEGFGNFGFGFEKDSNNGIQIWIWTPATKRNAPAWMQQLIPIFHWLYFRKVFKCLIINKANLIFLKQLKVSSKF